MRIVDSATKFAKENPILTASVGIGFVLIGLAGGAIASTHPETLAHTTNTFSQVIFRFCVDPLAKGQMLVNNIAQHRIYTTVSETIQPFTFKSNGASIDVSNGSLQPNLANLFDYVRGTWDLTVSHNHILQNLGGSCLELIERGVSQTR